MSATTECGREKFTEHVDPPPVARVTLGGSWGFYEQFYPRHCVRVPQPKTPEIAVKAGTTFYIPLGVVHTYGKPLELKTEVKLPSGWTVMKGEGNFHLPEEDRTDLMVEIATPELGKEEMKTLSPQELVVRVSADGKYIGEVRLKVLLKSSALAQ